MPTYEYACPSCDEHLEVVQSFRDEALTDCPACGGKLRKVFGSIGVVFKGSGFYKTDSRPATKSSSKSADATGSSGSSASDGGPKQSSSGGDGGPSKTDGGPSKTSGDKAGTSTGGSAAAAS